MASLLDLVKQTMRDADKISAAGGLTDADMLARMPASQRAGFLTSIGALQANPAHNSLNRSSAADPAERQRRVEGAAKAVKALKALSPEYQQTAARAKKPSGGGDDLSDLLNKPMSLDDMLSKAEEISKRK